jgi:hypothetical protein
MMLFIGGFSVGFLAAALAAVMIVKLTDWQIGPMF